MLALQFGYRNRKVHYVRLSDFGPPLGFLGARCNLIPLLELQTQRWEIARERAG